jgi:hypothetical protein
VEPDRVEPVDLERPRDLGAMLSTAFSLYGSNFVVFFGVALLVVIPTDLVFQGILADKISGYDDDPDLAATYIATMASALIANPLITAIHVRAVEKVGRGVRPAVGETVREGLAVFGVLFGTLLLFWIFVVLGFIALFVPGLFLLIRWWVAPQVVVVEGVTGMAALRRAWELTQNNWWRIFGITIVAGLIAGVASSVFTVPAVLAAEAAGSAPIELVAQIFADAIGYSFSALVGTLIYFDLRARKRLGPNWRDQMPGWRDPNVTPPPIVGDYPPPPPPPGGGYAPPPPGYHPPEAPERPPEAPERPPGA